MHMDMDNSTSSPYGLPEIGENEPPDWWDEIFGDMPDTRNFSENPPSPNKTWAINGGLLVTKPEKIIAIILSILGILANLSSLAAISCIRYTFPDILEISYLAGISVFALRVNSSDSVPA